MTTILMLTNCMAVLSLCQQFDSKYDNKSHAAGCRGMTQVLCSSISDDHYVHYMP